VYADPVLTREIVNPVARALWYIESHFAEEITLDDVANVAGVSRYHLPEHSALPRDIR